MLESVTLVYIILGALVFYELEQIHLPYLRHYSLKGSRALDSLLLASEFLAYQVSESSRLERNIQCKNRYIVLLPYTPILNALANF